VELQSWVAHAEVTLISLAQSKATHPLPEQRLDLVSSLQPLGLSPKSAMTTPGTLALEAASTNHLWTDAAPKPRYLQRAKYYGWCFAPWASESNRFGGS